MYFLEILSIYLCGSSCFSFRDFYISKCDTSMRFRKAKQEDCVGASWQSCQENELLGDMEEQDVGRVNRLVLTFREQEFRKIP